MLKATHPTRDGHFTLAPFDVNRLGGKHFQPQWKCEAGCPSLKHLGLDLRKEYAKPLAKLNQC